MSNLQRNARRPSKVYSDQPSGASVHPKIRGTKFEGILRNLIATHTAGDPVHQFARSVLTHTPEASVHLHKALKEIGHPAAKHFEPKAKMQRTARKYGRTPLDKLLPMYRGRLESVQNAIDQDSFVPDDFSRVHEDYAGKIGDLMADHADPVSDIAYKQREQAYDPQWWQTHLSGGSVDVGTSPESDHRLITTVLKDRKSKSPVAVHLNFTMLGNRGAETKAIFSPEEAKHIVENVGNAHGIPEERMQEIHGLLQKHFPHLYSEPEKMSRRRYSAAESANLTEGMNQAKFWLNDPMVKGKWSRFSNLVAQSPHLKGYLSRNGDKQLFPTKQHFNDFYEFVNNATPDEHAKVLGNATGPEAISKWKEQRENEQIPLRLTVANPDQFNKLLYKDGNKPAQRTLFRPIDGPAPKVGNFAYFTDPEGNAFHIAKVADTKDSNGKRKIVLDMQHRDEHTPAEKASYDKGWMDAQTGKDLKSGAGDFWTDDQHALYNLGRQDWHNKRIHGSSAPGVRTPDWKASEADGENEHIKGLVHAGVTAYLSKLLPHSTNGFSSALLQHPKAAALTDGITSEVLGVWQKALQKNPRLRERNLNNLIRNVVKRNITSNPTALHVGNLIDNDLEGYLKHTGGINTPEDIHEYRNDLFDRKGIDLSRDAVLEALHRLQMGKDYNSPLSGRDADTRNTSEIANDSAEKLRHLVDDGTNPLFDNPFHYQQAAKMIPMLQALSSPSEHRRMQRTAQKYAAGEQHEEPKHQHVYHLIPMDTQRNESDPLPVKPKSFVDALNFAFILGDFQSDPKLRQKVFRSLGGKGCTPWNIDIRAVYPDNSERAAYSHEWQPEGMAGPDAVGPVGKTEDLIDNAYYAAGGHNYFRENPDALSFLRSVEQQQSLQPLRVMADWMEERGHDHQKLRDLIERHRDKYSRRRSPKKVQR